MAEQDCGIAGSHAAGRLDKGLLFQHQRVATYQARESGNREYRHGDDDVRHAAAHHRHHGNRQQNTGKGKQHVADTHDDAVPPAFVIPGHQPQHGANCCAHQHSKDPGRQRDLRPYQHAAENIAPERVHAKPVHHRRSIVQPVVIEVIFRIKRGYPGGDNRHQDQQ